MFPSLTIRCARVQQRWVFAVMGSLAVLNAYSMRICLSLAITEMVKPQDTISNSTVSDDSCPSSEATSSSSSNGGTYEWDEYTQGIILSSFYWGYIATQIPGGLLAERFGGKWTLGLGIFSTAVFTLLTPVAVQTLGSTGLIVIRILMGLGEGATYPAIGVLIAQWAPTHERTRIANMVLSGNMLGTVIGNALSGVLIRYFSVGWPLVFYVFGAVAVLWFIVWVAICYNHPDEHPFISEDEKRYIHDSIRMHTQKEKGPTPWRHILTSAPVWALLLAKAGFSWGLHTMMSDLPKYMSNVLKFSIQANGFLSALPYLLTWLVSNLVSWLADWLIGNDKLSRTHVRKLYATVAAVVSASLLVAASYAGCNRTVVVMLFTFGVGTMGFFFPGVVVNSNDLSPNYSGTVMGIANIFTALSGIATPYVVGVLTPNRTLLEWRNVFWLTFGISAVTTLIYSIWGDGEVQHWNSLESPEEKRTKSASSERTEKNVTKAVLSRTQL